MKKRAIVVAPGRGTYNKDELGYLKRYHGDKAALFRAFDAYRIHIGQEPVTGLDSAERFSGRLHIRGDNASPLIFACAYADYRTIDQDNFEIVAITGNSMGWYIALTCAGALGPVEGLEVVNMMGTLMQEKLIGGQLIYPFFDINWQEIPGERERIEAKMNAINARPQHELALSIDLGGMLALAGNDAGLAAFEAEMPKMQERYPMRLPNHAAFHTRLQEPVSAEGRHRLSPALFAQPEVPLIDGRGAIWNPDATDISALWDYTLGQQVVQPYDFTRAITVAAREFMPDVFVVLGPGATLGGALVQSLIRARWRGLDSKEMFQERQAGAPFLLSMGIADQRKLVTNA